VGRVIPIAELLIWRNYHEPGGVRPRNEQECDASRRFATADRPTARLIEIPRVLFLSLKQGLQRRPNRKLRAAGAIFVAGATRNAPSVW
jgi:hypothetical protein